MDKLWNLAARKATMCKAPATWGATMENGSLPPFQNAPLVPFFSISPNWLRFLTLLPSAPCSLPKIYHGQYMSGYRAGLTIANGSSVTFQCEEDYEPSSVQPLECLLGRSFQLVQKGFCHSKRFLGELHPQSPTCRKEGDFVPETHYLGGKDIVKGGDITVIEYGRSNGKPCGPPAK